MKPTEKIALGAAIAGGIIPCFVAYLYLSATGLQGMLSWGFWFWLGISWLGLASGIYDSQIKQVSRERIVNRDTLPH